jgi:hypothetical protein
MTILERGLKKRVRYLSYLMILEVFCNARLKKESVLSQLSYVLPELLLQLLMLR